MDATVADTFARDNLPPREAWPDFVLDRPEFRYPERLNCVTALLDSWLASGHGDAPCLLAPGIAWSYRDTAERVNRIARVLVDECGLRPGERVLLRAPNTPMMAAATLAVLKAGGIAVGTMPLLRARELHHPLRKARIGLALCDARLLAELREAAGGCPELRRIVAFGTDAPDGLEAMMAQAPADFPPADTAADDVCLIAFTSGTTGVPKGTMHFHRDVLATCDSYARHVLRPREADRFIGSPPLAFTFGLGGLLLFPLWAGAATILLERAGPDDLVTAIAQHRASVCFTAPTAYRAMLGKLAGADLASLRVCVAAGETLPRATFEAWQRATGLRIMDGIGSTEMLHIFIGSPAEEARAGSTGRPVPGYQARIVDAEGRELPDGTAGRLAVRGPTGCRYLADARQRDYVQGGWNITGDFYLRDADGYFWYQARADDMIVSSGYNIAGPEVEDVLLGHPAVAECGVIGTPDEERGQIVKAFVVLAAGFSADPATVETLQDYVKATIAPYKYPRAIEFRDSLPRTGTGKLQRFRLRESP
ncbi:MAG: benzoate-CoA ligase family protein [Acidisphaera sp.]|nr:benzoate-CoA ligase family protein [Acidisphaera sp.]